MRSLKKGALLTTLSLVCFLFAGLSLTTFALEVQTSESIKKNKETEKTIGQYQEDEQEEEEILEYTSPVIPATNTLTKGIYKEGETCTSDADCGSQCCVQGTCGEDIMCSGSVGVQGSCSDSADCRSRCCLAGHCMNPTFCTYGAGARGDFCTSAYMCSESCC